MNAALALLSLAVFWAAVAAIVIAWLRHRTRVKEWWHEREMKEMEQTDALVEQAEREYEREK